MAATITLVDDDKNILTSVSIALEAEGYKVATHTDGQSALAAMTEQAPDLAVLDIKMPGLDGMELLNRLRRVSSVPVIFLTSKDEEIDEMLGLKMGADDYIRKPFYYHSHTDKVKNNNTIFECRIKIINYNTCCRYRSTIKWTFLCTRVT